MSRVEIVHGFLASDETYQTIEAFARELGKTPVEAQNFPSFVSNRILMPMINEAIGALYGGVATAEAIDTVVASNGLRAVGRQGRVESCRYRRDQRAKVDGLAFGHELFWLYP